MKSEKRQEASQESFLFNYLFLMYYFSVPPTPMKQLSPYAKVSFEIFLNSLLECRTGGSFALKLVYAFEKGSPRVSGLITHPLFSLHIEVIREVCRLLSLTQCSVCSFHYLPQTAQRGIPLSAYSLHIFRVSIFFFSCG